MIDIHKKIAEGIKLISMSYPNRVVVPIGLDGIIISHLVDCYFVKNYGRIYTDSLPNTVCISSKRENSDTEKFKRILKNANRTVCAVDMRTKSGETGKLLRLLANEINPKIDFRYAVLFDPNENADIAIFHEELKDSERIVWMGKDLYDKIFVKTDVGWQYNISHELFDSLPDVQKIKEFI